MFDITIRKKQELEIAHNLQQQKFLSEISMQYNTIANFENNTNKALRLIGTHLNVSRVYIFKDSEDGEYTSNIFEWCNKGIDAQIKELQNIPYSAIKSWKTILREDGIIFSENIKELPDDVVEILEPQGIKSILVLPLRQHEKQIGFIGFDECMVNRSWRESEIELLRTISNIISHSYLRQQIQNELIESERENRIIIESIPDIIIQANSAGEIKALKASQKQNLSNLIKSEDSWTIFEAFNEKISALLYSAITQCLEHEKSQVEFKNLNREQLQYYEARLVKLDENEVMIIVRDVTVIREHEIQLEIAKNEAEEASRMKSEFLANVSHEVRTPLNAILGFSQWLLDNTSETLHKSYLRTILKSGKGLLDVINDILDISRIESGSIKMDMHIMSYKDVMSDINSVFGKKAQEKGLNFEIITETSVPGFIIMDEIRFYQIIFNLVNNAIKFTEKGFVQVSSIATKTSVEDEVNLVVTIEDSGIGIEKEQQSKIFESFTQYSGRKNRSYEGTGLGLAIANGLLRKLNGSIKLSSEPGKGSTFKLTFLNVKIGKNIETTDQAKELDVKFKLKPCSIMIVDDIEYNIKVLKTHINSKEVKYLEAKDGNIAHAILQIERPDIIFMDIRMPGMDGFELTKMIKEDENLKNIPVIAFSASTIKNRKELINELFDDYLIKPVFKKNLDPILLKYIPHVIEYENEKVPEENVSGSEITNERPQNIDHIVSVLESEFQPKWEEIKDNLIIYEIETFKKELSEFAFKESCSPLTSFCDELDLGLHSFDIELIGTKIGEFPKLKNQLKLLAEKGK
jgi:signal transduction histidine kinase/FixJ family two-component response regulator